MTELVDFDRAAQSNSGLGFVRALRIQIRVIRALMLREALTRHGRHNIGFLWIFVEPMMFTTGIVSLWSTFHHESRSGMPMVAFCVSGYGSVLAWRNTIGRACEAAQGNKALFFHRNVRILDVFVARSLLEMAGASVSFAVLSTFFVFTGFMKLPEDILNIIWGWGLLLWFAFAMGLIVGSLAVYSEIVTRLWHVLSYLFLPMSGAFFMVDWLSSHLQKLALFVPTVDCTEMLRAGLFGGAIHTHYHAGYVAFVNLGLTLLGLCGLRIVTKELEDSPV